MENLRKVTYTLEGWVDEGFDPRPEVREQQRNRQKTRNGLFHRWADKVRVENGEYFQETYGIIEDSETKEIKEIVPKRVKFID